MIRPDLAVGTLALALCLSACGEPSAPVAEKPARTETATENAMQPAIPARTARSIRSNYDHGGING